MDQGRVKEPRPGGLEQQLLTGIEALGLEVSDDAIQKLLAYVDLLQRWNRAYNLTAIREPENMVSHHVLDSLSILPYVNGPRVLDMGTGPGLPGMPLAILLPGFRFTLLDSNGKKTRFLIQARAELGLGNVEVVQSRVEDYLPEQPFDTVTARAFSSLAGMLARSRDLCRPNGRYLFMKGRLPKDELAALPEGFTLIQTVVLSVPGVDAERHLIVLAPRTVGPI